MLAALTNDEVEIRWQVAGLAKQLGNVRFAVRNCNEIDLRQAASQLLAALQHFHPATAFFFFEVGSFPRGVTFFPGQFQGLRITGPNDLVDDAQSDSILVDGIERMEEETLTGIGGEGAGTCHAAFRLR